jgi:hypothetical protein
VVNNISFFIACLLVAVTAAKAKISTGALRADHNARPHTHVFLSKRGRSQASAAFANQHVARTTALCVFSHVKHAADDITSASRITALSRALKNLKTHLYERIF